jgi:hypothetical protein
MRVFLLLLVLFPAAAVAQPKDTWAEFARTKFETKYFQEIGEYLFTPTFSSELQAQVGKEVSLEGYYLPLDTDGKYIILSKYPYSQCFFCGAAGPESIAEVYFAQPPGKFVPDQYIRVKGKLKLNTDDLEHGNFIIEQAVLAEK